MFCSSSDLFHIIQSTWQSLLGMKLLLIFRLTSHKQEEVDCVCNFLELPVRKSIMLSGRETESSLQTPKEQLLPCVQAERRIFSFSWLQGPVTGVFNLHSKV